MNAYDLLARISEPIPGQLLSTKTKGGAAMTFCAWYDLCDLMDERAPGWCSEVRVVDGPAPTVIVRVTVPTDDGALVREATGTDDEPNSNYGSPLDRAEASALRRVFAKFGLGRELYGGKAAPARQAKHARERQASVTVAPAVATNGHDPATDTPPADGGQHAPPQTAPLGDVAAEAKHYAPMFAAATSIDGCRAIMRDVAALPDGYHKSGAIRHGLVRMYKLCEWPADVDSVNDLYARAYNKLTKKDAALVLAARTVAEKRIPLDGADDAGDMTAAEAIVEAVAQ